MGRALDGKVEKFNHIAYWCYFHNVNFHNRNEPPSAQLAAFDAYNGELYYDDLTSHTGATHHVTPGLQKLNILMSLKLLKQLLAY